MKFILTTNTVILNINGKHAVINKSDPKFPEIYKILKGGDENALKEILERHEKTMEEYIKDSGLFLNDGVLTDSDGEVLPKVFSNRLCEMKDDGFSVEHMVKFWNNLKDNPSLRSREQLYFFLEQNGHPITPDGCFIAYRGVTSDFKDRHTRSFDNSVGNILEMPRKDVDDDPNRTCSRGFHVAAYEYAHNFSAITVTVKVNPRDVVAVPADYNGQKMRVCRFEVLEVCDQKLSNNSVYNGNDESFDAYEENEDVSLYQGDIDLILDYAVDYGARYNDRSSLAVRIEEEMWWLDAGQILEVINEHW